MHACTHACIRSCTYTQSGGDNTEGYIRTKTCWNIFLSQPRRLICIGAACDERGREKQNTHTGINYHRYDIILRKKPRFYLGSSVAIICCQLSLSPNNFAFSAIMYCSAHVYCTWREADIWGRGTCVLCLYFYIFQGVSYVCVSILFQSLRDFLLYLESRINTVRLLSLSVYICTLSEGK